MQEYKYKMLISYDGTNYFGWQIQKNKLTIQEAIQKELSKILTKNIKLIGAGRTDAKVHALEQVAHFSYNKKLDLKKVLFSLNSLLSDDIRKKNFASIRKALWKNSLWSPSYFASSCGGAPLSILQEYIQKQQLV